ncbi:MAG: hypothetical protein QXT33_02990 [Thermofilum sp.]
MKVAVVLLPGERSSEVAASWLVGYLRAIGVEQVDLLRAEDDLSAITSSYRSHDALVVVGASGNPDAVRAIASALGLGVEVSEEALTYVRSYYSDRFEVPADLERLALVPEFSYVVPNERGAAPAFVASSLTEDKFIAGLPQSLGEAVECFEKSIQDFFREKTGRRFSATFAFYLAGSAQAAGEVAAKLSSKVEGVFARVDYRFMGAEGLPLVVTIYAATAEELYERITAVEGELKQLAEQAGLTVLQGGITGQGEEELTL